MNIGFRKKEQYLFKNNSLYFKISQYMIERCMKYEQEEREEIYKYQNIFI